jgi:hypothetical protein
MSVIIAGLASKPKLILYAEDYGITAEAVERYQYRKPVLGKVIRVELQFNEPLITKGDDGWNMLIEGEEDVLALSGCNCGYAGEGPRGAITILADIGVPEDQYKEVISNKYLLFTLVNGTWSCEAVS